MMVHAEASALAAARRLSEKPGSLASAAAQQPEVPVFAELRDAGSDLFGQLGHDGEQVADQA
ncbi:hypothetical protein, partial [Sphingomonas zeae]